MKKFSSIHSSSHYGHSSGQDKNEKDGGDDDDATLMPFIQSISFPYQSRQEKESKGVVHVQKFSSDLFDKIYV